MTKPDSPFKGEVDLYRWLTRGSVPLAVRPDELVRQCRDGVFESGMLFLDYLVSLGLAVRQGASYVIEDPPTARALLVLSPTNNEVAVQRTTVAPKVKPGDLVAGVPFSMQSHVAAVMAKHTSIRVWTIQEAFTGLFMEAHQEILLVLPFLEPDGIGFLIEHIGEAGRRNVSIRVLGRGIIQPEPSVHPFRHAERRRAFKIIIDAFVGRGGSTHEIAVRDFGRTLVNDGDEPAHYESIHQKMMVVDRRISYTGSGEIRMASFVSNGEVGQIHGATVSSFWADFFHAFWTRAQPVQF